MSQLPPFLPSRDLRDLRALDLTSPECLDAVRNNLDSLAILLGASGGQIIHAPPKLEQVYEQDSCLHEPDVEHPPREVDSFEKSYVTRWLTRLISELLSISTDDDATAASLQRLSERCAELLALSAGRMAAGASVQDHIFQLDDQTLSVKLRDGALVHDSLGTHTWGAAPILSQLLLPLKADTCQDLNILELGAGTGLVGLAIALWSRQHRTESATHLVCSDYHPTVLGNLAHNLALNGWPSSGKTASSSASVEMIVRSLDWQSVHRAQYGDASDQVQKLTSQTLPSHLAQLKNCHWAAPLDAETYSGSFDLLVAADCVYDPLHPFWIRSVAQKLLRMPDSATRAKPLLHVMVPLRPTHQQEMEAVYQAFQPELNEDCPQLVILSEQDYQGYENFGAWNSVVRGGDDTSQSQPEGGLPRTYRWFQIGWQGSKSSTAQSIKSKSKRVG
ncbi:uncharacterized protein UDID_02083 [Ustilago sp. UG-2017a]|nr:uncharacterized protein UDID_02083 [Ustilago sp. UG-2017a]